jgi:ribosomal biogenesis protein LAS1
LDYSFVTGFVDSKLHGQKQTMFQKAAVLGIPTSFVELRHEATHRDLPSLAVLRGATQRALEWLWDYYWEKLEFSRTAATGITVSSLPGDTESIKKELRRICDQIMQEETAEPSREKRRLDHAHSVGPHLMSICKRRSNGICLLSTLLLQEYIIVPVGQR